MFPRPFQYFKQKLKPAAEAPRPAYQPENQIMSITRGRRGRVQISSVLVISDYSVVSYLIITNLFILN